MNRKEKKRLQVQKVKQARDRAREQSNKAWNDVLNLKLGLARSQLDIDDTSRPRKPTWADLRMEDHRKQMATIGRPETRAHHTGTALPRRYEGEMAVREARAQQEIQNKRKRVVPLFNKGPAAYFTDDMDPKTIGRK